MSNISGFAQHKGSEASLLSSVQLLLETGQLKSLTISDGDDVPIWSVSFEVKEGFDAAKLCEYLVFLEA